MRTQFSRGRHRSGPAILENLKLHITKADCKLNYPGSKFYTAEAQEDNARQMMAYFTAEDVELCLYEKPQFHIIASTLTGGHGAPFASLVEELAITQAEKGHPNVYLLQSLVGAGNTLNIS